MATKTKTKTRTKTKSPETEALTHFRKALRAGDDWFEALLEAIGRWEASEEEVDGRRFRYLIAGEAFDWLLLAERLCEAANGKIPDDEREALLFYGRAPRAMDDSEFRRAIGDSKHRAHLNFLYGIAVEEALQVSVEEEVLKERRSNGGWAHREAAELQVYERIYGRTRDELLQAFAEEGSLAPGGEISFGDWRAFTYWLFKFRVNQSDPARVASDTRKALAQISELEAASRRRAHFLTFGGAVDSPVVEGEVVARVR